MIDARRTPVDWDKPPKPTSQGILSPFQWSPAPQADLGQAFTGDITSFYYGPQFQQDDDSFSFFDQSFFFMDQLELADPTPLPTKPLQNSQQRISFASKLTNCHRQRMSTIIEFPVNEDSSTEEGESEEDDGNVSEVASQPRRDLHPGNPQHSGIKKLLDYVVPYPTRRVKRNIAKQRRRNTGSSIKTVSSGSTSSSGSERSSMEENEWVAHGFFEILKGH